MLETTPYESSEHLERPPMEAELDATASDVERLRFHVERLYLLTEALWTILKIECQYDDTVLTELVNKIDLRDGKADGKVAPELAPTCPQCHRTHLSRYSATCLYCDAPMPLDLFRR